MAELKAFEVSGKALFGRTYVKKVYLKSEVDKVIAELKAQKAQAEDDCAYWKTMAQKNAEDNAVMAKQRAEAFERERHHKYKRCLAIAERCNDKIDNPVQCDEHDDWLIITEYWERWHKRWLELAEKFKEGK